MFTVKAREPINSSQDTIQLLPDQVWEGLLIRARNQDERFVPPGHRFENLSDDGSTIVRKIYLDDGREEVERITLHGRRVVVIDFIEGFQRSQILTSIENDDDGNWYLALTFLVQFMDLEPGGSEELALAEVRRPRMAAQPARILQVIRELVTEGRIA